MKKWICQNCDSKIETDLEVCPKCGLYRDAFNDDVIKDNDKPTESAKNHEFSYPPKKEKSIEDAIRLAGKHIRTIKNILVFFMVLWIIGVLVTLIALLTK